MSDCPFCIGGIEAPEPYIVKAFPNRWPALTPGDGVEFARLGRELTKRAPARGASEVVLYSPDHNTTFASLGSEQIRRVIDVWAARTEALLSRREIQYVLVFENRGPEVGATISHPHSQIYAFPFVPPVAAMEAAVAEAIRAGDVRFRVELRSQTLGNVPVVEEESTNIYEAPAGTGPAPARSATTPGASPGESRPAPPPTPPVITVVPDVPAPAGPPSVPPPSPP